MRKILFTSVFLLSMLFSCEDLEETTRLKDLGAQAADEFCSCYKNNSKDHCLDALTSKYKYADYMNNNFIEAFNTRSSCGIELEKIYTSK